MCRPDRERERSRIYIYIYSFIGLFVNGKWLLGRCDVVYLVSCIYVDNYVQHMYFSVGFIGEKNENMIPFCGS